MGDLGVLSAWAGEVPRRSHRLRGRLGRTPGKVPDRISKSLRPESRGKAEREGGRQSGLNGEDREAGRGERVKVFRFGSWNVTGGLGGISATGFWEGKLGCRRWRREWKPGMEIAFLGKLGWDGYGRQGGRVRGGFFFVFKMEVISTCLYIER